MAYPVELILDGRNCLVAGGGRVAARRVPGLLAAGAHVTVVSPELDRRLAGPASAGDIRWQQDIYRPDVLDGMFLAIAATNDPPVNEQVVRDARARGILTCRVDHAGAADFRVPAVVRRGKLLLSVSTSGKSPVLARILKHQLEGCYGPEYGLLLDLLADLRQEARSLLPGSKGDQLEKNARFQQELAQDELLLHLLRSGDLGAARNRARGLLARRLDGEEEQ